MENLLYFLPFLACPVMMGLMMWMMRGNKDQATTSCELPAHTAAAGNSPDERLALLRAQLADMETRQAGITAQIGQLQAAGRVEELPSGVETDPVRLAPLSRGRST